MRFYLCVYFLLSGVTWVSGEAGQGVSGRLAVPDLLMAGLMAWLLVMRPSSLRVPPVARAAGLMLVVFMFGLLNSSLVAQSMLEWTVHAFLVAGCVAVYSVMVREDFEGRMRIATWWVRMSLLLAAVGLWEFFAPIVGLPSFIALFGQTVRTRAGVVGTFRNTGQAGVFYVTALATAIPLQRLRSGRARLEMSITVAVLSLAVILTVKRSAMLALLGGAVLLLVIDPSLRGRWRTMLTLAGASLVAIPVLRWVASHWLPFVSRVNYKLGEDAAENMAGFAVDNIEATLRAFTAHPLTGAGLGGVAGVYSEKFEIHSTYLGVLGMTGILGVAAYLYFTVVCFRTALRPRNPLPEARLYGRLFLPMFLGLMLCYSYTYQLRKREFWVTMAIVSAMLGPGAARGEGGSQAPVLMEDPPATRRRARPALAPARL